MNPLSSSASGLTAPAASSAIPAVVDPFEVTAVELVVGMAVMVDFVGFAPAAEVRVGLMEEGVEGISSIIAIFTILSLMVCRTALLQLECKTIRSGEIV